MPDSGEVRERTVPPQSIDVEMDSARNLKRQRTQEAKVEGGDDEDSIPQLKPHERLWFDDGNVVIVAAATLFRVHRGILSHYSSVWKRLLAQQEVDPERLFDCPALRLVDDNAADVEYVLDSMYDMNFIRARQLKITVVSAFLRLGTKYDIKQLREEAIHRLSICYPNRLYDYYKLEDADFVRPIPSDPTHCEEFLVSLLALVYDLKALLPVALYKCCVSTPADAFLPMVDKARGLSGGTVRHAQLFLQTCLAGRAKLVKQRAKVAFAFLDGTLGPQCRSEARCESLMKKMLADAYNHDFIIDNPAAIDDASVSFIDYNEYREEACRDCFRYFMQRHDEGRKRAWDALPWCFGLEIPTGDWHRHFG
ncbi:hypothetical protein BV25DRAFT_1829394 [Artomyces pyxidatus]|uniref:Uncharacterized protein n=1 Tax=Artomyces pyxidatus TaxID=48021 RepID=A0ACB8SRS7_9AGAM|nr:hypothetical protein BV25DRAFT_1829394 [Artomyces pyxidatus]